MKKGMLLLVVMLVCLFSVLLVNAEVYTPDRSTWATIGASTNQWGTNITNNFFNLTDLVTGLVDSHFKYANFSSSFVNSTNITVTCSATACELVINGSFGGGASTDLAAGWNWVNNDSLVMDNGSLYRATVNASLVENNVTTNSQIANTENYISNKSKYVELETINVSNLTSPDGGFTLTISDDGSNHLFESDVDGNSYLGWATSGSFTQLYANPNVGNDYVMYTITETQGDTTTMNFYEGGTGHNRFWSSGSIRIGGSADNLCSALTSDVDCDTAVTGADLVIQDDIWIGGKALAIDWGNVTVNESQIPDLAHTTDTNANTLCAGTNVYLDGEGNCDTLDTTEGNVTNNIQLVNGAGYITATLTQEEVEDFAGGMDQGTETRLTFTYNDGTGNFDIVVDDMNDDIPESGDFGNAADLEGTGALSASVVSDNEIDYSTVTLNDFTNDAGYIKNNTDVELHNLSVQNINVSSVNFTMGNIFFYQHNSTCDGWRKIGTTGGYLDCT